MKVSRLSSLLWLVCMAFVASTCWYDMCSPGSVRYTPEALKKLQQKLLEKQKAPSQRRSSNLPDVRSKAPTVEPSAPEEEMPPLVWTCPNCSTIFSNLNQVPDKCPSCGASTDTGAADQGFITPPPPMPSAPVIRTGAQTPQPGREIKPKQRRASEGGAPSTAFQRPEPKPVVSEAPSLAQQAAAAALKRQQEQKAASGAGQAPAVFGAPAPALKPGSTEEKAEEPKVDAAKAQQALDDYTKVVDDMAQPGLFGSWKGRSIPDRLRRLKAVEEGVTYDEAGQDNNNLNRIAGEHFPNQGVPALRARAEAAIGKVARTTQTSLTSKLKTTMNSEAEYAVTTLENTLKNAPELYAQLLPLVRTAVKAAADDKQEALNKRIAVVEAAKAEIDAKAQAAEEKKAAQEPEPSVVGSRVIQTPPALGPSAGREEQPTFTAPVRPASPAPAPSRPASPAPAPSRPASPAPAPSRPASPAPAPSRPASPAPAPSRPASPAPAPAVAEVKVAEPAGVPAEIKAAIDTLTQSVAGKSDNDKVDATNDIMTQIAALPVEQQQQSLTYLKQQLGLKAEAQQELDRALTIALDVAKALTR